MARCSQGFQKARVPAKLSPYHRIMRVCFLMMLGLAVLSSAYADISWVKLETSTPVYQAGDDEANYLFMANKGEKVAVRSEKNGFSRVQIKRGGKWRTGYIRSADLEVKDRRASQWGFGGGGMYSYLRHTGKKFQTEDEVEYNTGITTSAAVSPWFAAQFNRKNFWRVILAYRRASFASTASTNVSGSLNDLQLDYSMFSGAIQKMWTPFSQPFFYYGIGIEASRALSADLKIDNKSLPVDQSTLPTYFGGHLAGGGQFNLSRSLSCFVEARLVGYLNQEPMIFGAELASGLIYWP